MTAYAHTLAGEASRERWEPLERHLEAVAELAASFAARFGAEDWAHLLGRYHDLGKYSEAFQTYLQESADVDAGASDRRPGRVDHSTFGAQFVSREVGQHTGLLLAYCIAGHHAGLPDGIATEASLAASSLKARLALQAPRVPLVTLPTDIRPLARPKLPFRLSSELPGFSLAFFGRMLFSCLIDADRTATERFCRPDKASKRAQGRPTIEALAEAVRSHTTKLTATAADSAVNRLRAGVLDQCRSAAGLAPGLFSLNVPTGGGKTLNGLSFALEHAKCHGLDRVVVAIPYTSIIEQTADVYRGALGELADSGLLEHHTNVRTDEATRANQLAVENWDVPLIVTTNVQLFDSLFESATTPCRKLHRLARSVIVLDEAHTIPVDLLSPTLAALRELVERYGCSVVLCTATQPALERRSSFPIGVTDVRAIVDDATALHRSLRRVEVTHLGQLSDEGLIERLDAERSALCIVNTRPQAAHIYHALRDLRDGNDGLYHLSTRMCAAHRRQVLDEIRRALRANEPCVVISTQLIEAGVDVDFPVVYRAQAGFDSIAQAAGRCNREGTRDRGSVYTFESATLPPPGLLRQAAQKAQELRSLHSDPLDPSAIEAYFALLYWSQSDRWDHRQVMRAFQPDPGDPFLDLRYRAASERYRTIVDSQVSVLVPWDDKGARIRAALESPEFDMRTMRAAQPYLVGVHENDMRQLIEAHAVVAHESGLHLLDDPGRYHAATGLDAGSQSPSEALII